MGNRNPNQDSRTRVAFQLTLATRLFNFDLTQITYRFITGGVF